MKGRRESRMKGRREGRRGRQTGKAGGKARWGASEMGAEAHSALYGTRDWAGKRATLEQTLSTPPHRAFPPKISHPKGFRNTILESPTTVSLRRSNEHQRAEKQTRQSCEDDCLVYEL